MVDALQGDASHSEGQGWGMTLATAFDDAEALARMFAWTEAHLAVRQDPLLAWRWRPDAGVTDFNNATDGDLFYAWALLKAARQFGVPHYAERAAAVADAIDKILIREAPNGQLVLRPAAERFSTPDVETINPSYYMPLAMHALAAAFDIPRLARVSDDGEALLARIAKQRLVPDWVEITPEGLQPPMNLPATYGYDALRVPLYLTWSGRFAHPAVSRARGLVSTQEIESVPVRVDEAGEISERSDAPGYIAVARLLRCTGMAGSSTKIPRFIAQQSYYPATLHLLAVIAAAQAAPHCIT